MSREARERAAKLVATRRMSPVVGARDDGNDARPRPLRERRGCDAVSATAGVDREDLEPILRGVRVHSVRELAGSADERGEGHEHPEGERKDAVSSRHLPQHEASMTDDLRDSVLGAMKKLLLLPGALVLGLGLASCGKTAEEIADAGKTSNDASSTAPTVDSGIVFPPTDATLPLVDAAPDAHVACTTEDASACDTIPPSVCVDGQVVYFSAGRCVDGMCTWKTTAMGCGAQSYCMNGGCTPPTTK